MQRLSKALRESPVDYKAPLTESYRPTVILTVGGMYATDDLDLILFLWWSNLYNELTERRVACLPGS